MGWFNRRKKQAEPGLEVKEALKELKENLTRMHTKVAGIRAEETRLRLRWKSVSEQLETHRKYLEKATKEGRAADISRYQVLIANLEKQEEKAKTDYITAQENLMKAEDAEKDMTSQVAELSLHMREIEDSLDDIWYYRDDDSVE